MVASVGDVVAELVRSTPTLEVEGIRVTPKELQAEVAEVMNGVKALCSTSGSCSDAEISRALEVATEVRSSSFNRIVRTALRPFRRLLVLALYSATVIGPGALTYYLASNFNIPEGQRLILGFSVGAISGTILGRAGAVLEKMIGPHVEQHVMMVWDPNSEDSWGAIQKALNEKDRLSFSQIYNQLDTMKDHLVRAGTAVKGGDLDEAARHYAVSILHSAHLFGGLHFYAPSTVSEVRSWLPRRMTGDRWEVDIPLDRKIELVLKVCRELSNRPGDEIAPGLDKRELVRFGYGVMIRWLINHPSPGVNGHTTGTNAS